jgi:hypothetical protein
MRFGHDDSVAPQRKTVVRTVLSTSSTSLTAGLPARPIVMDVRIRRAPKREEQQMKKHLAAAAIALGSVVGGVAFGATVFAPTVSGAQEASADPTPEAGAQCANPDHAGPARGLDAAAEAIGISADDLHTALEGGQSIAEVAAAHGVDTQTVVDAMVADLKAHLADAVADGKISQTVADTRLANATEHITARVNGDEPPARPDGDRPGRPPRGERPPADTDGDAG